MQTTKTIGNKNTTKSSLPNITTPTISYSQRYEHMTKIANYNELNEAQIWKQYQKLRICLKELNEQVLFHMQKKAHTNLYSKQAPVSPSVEATLILLEQQRRASQTRLHNFNSQHNSLELRVQHLTNKRDFLLEINNDIEINQAKIRDITVENKDLKRKQKLISRDLANGPSLLQKLLKEQQLLHFANKKYQKYDKMYKTSISKIQDLDQRANENKKAFQVRLGQFKSQQNYIEQQINLQRYQELQAKKLNAVKYQSVYKKNYLMKLKELQNLMNSIKRHDEVIHQNQANIMKMRSQIDSISSVVGSGRKKNSVSMIQHHHDKSFQDKSVKSGRKSIAVDRSLDLKENEIRKTTNENGQFNDKNKGQSLDKK